MAIDPRWLARLLSADGRVVGAGVLLGTRHVLTSTHLLTGPDGELLVDFADLPDPTPARVAPDGWQPTMGVALLELDEPRPDGTGAELHHHLAPDDVRVFGFPPGTDAGVWVEAETGRGGELIQLTGDHLTSDFAGGPVLDYETGQLLGIVTVRAARARLLPTGAIVRSLPQVARWVVGEVPIAARLDQLITKAGQYSRYGAVFTAPRDPTDALIPHPVMPEGARFCVNAGCRSPVGRSYGGRPGLDRGFCTRCGTPFDFTPPLGPGEVVADRYEVVGCLARGGFAWLFLARDRVGGDIVVLKSVTDDYALAITEDRLLSMSRDPGVVRVLDLVRQENSGRRTDFLVMEYVDGRSLRDAMREPLRPEQVAAYGVEILSIVARLHGRGLLHCDIKPDNVIQRGGRLTLIDLGAARLIADRVSPVIGTKGYQVSDEELTTHGPTVRSDLYAIGRTLQDLLRTTSHEEKPLHRLVARALAPYEERYTTADEMRDQLMGVLREMLSLRDQIPRPVPSALFSPMSAPLDGGLGDIPAPAAIVCPSPAEVAAALPTVHDSADAALRADWHAGVEALAAGNIATAEVRFNRCYDAVPGEIAPKVALAFCAELLGRVSGAIEHYERVWWRDRTVACAAFGLARQGEGLANLDEVPDDSPSWTRAQVAAVRALVSPALTWPTTALDRIPAIGLDRAAQARLTAEVLETLLRTDTLPASLGEREVRDRLAELRHQLATYEPTPRFTVAVDRTQTGDTLTVTVAVTANRRARDVRFAVWTTRGTTPRQPESGALGDLRRRDQRSIQLTFQTRAAGTPPGEAVVADVELSVGAEVVAAVPIVGNRTALPAPQPSRDDLEHVVAAMDVVDRRSTLEELRTAVTLASRLDDHEALVRLQQLADLVDTGWHGTPSTPARSTQVRAMLLAPSERTIVPTLASGTALLERPPVTSGRGVQARVRCDADVVVPGQRARIALTVWAGEPAPLDDPVRLRVVLDSAPAEVHPVSRVTVLTDDRGMTPVDFDVVPEEPGPLPLVFRIYRDADSHLLLEVRAELPVEEDP